VPAAASKVGHQSIFAVTCSLTRPGAMRPGHWIKQHLRIKAFFGTSENAVKSQVWTAVSVYVLVAIVKKRLALPVTLYEILQILSLSLFEKTPVNCLFHDNPHQKIPTADPNQLTLFN
jgi:hypothetical protein